MKEEISGKMAKNEEIWYAKNYVGLFLLLLSVLIVILWQLLLSFIATGILFALGFKLLLNEGE